MPDQQKEIPDSPNLRGTIHLEKKKKYFRKVAKKLRKRCVDPLSPGCLRG